MEVATYQPDGVLSVHEASSMASDIIRTLDPRTRLRILATREAEDGSLRALVVLDVPSSRVGRQPSSPRGQFADVTPLGWVTCMTADGEPLVHLHARPFYVVTDQPLKVRKEFEESSTFVRKLPVGTRLHVMETRRTPSGKHRVHAVLLGDEDPSGWVTARMEDGSRTLREMREEELAGPMPHATRQHLLRPPLRDSAAEDGDPARPSTTRGSTISASELRQAQMKRPASARDLLVKVPPLGIPITSTSVQISHHKKSSWQKKFGSNNTGRNGMDKEEAEKDKAASPGKNSGGGGSNSNAAKDAAAFKRWSTSASNSQISDAADDMLAQRVKFEKSTTYQAITDRLMQQAADEEEAVAHKPTRVRIGEQIEERNLNLADLVREWDPKQEGTISKMEFRQALRKFFPKNTPETAEIDNFFYSMDGDGSGKLETNELRVALGKFRAAAKVSAVGTREAYERAEQIRQKAQRVTKVTEITVSAEQAAAELEAKRLGSVGSQLGDRLNAKGLKEADIAMRWSKNGEIRQSDFRREVIALVPGLLPADVDALFQELDADGGGSLDRDELKDALKRLKAEAEEKKNAIREYGLLYIQAFKLMKVAQVEYSKVQKVEEEAAKEEQLRAKKEEAERAAAEEEAKQVKLVAKAEKAKAAVAEKKALELRVALKRAAAASGISI